MNWAARNGSPTMSPSTHSAPPPMTWSLLRLGSPRPGQRVVVGPGDQALVREHRQAEDGIADHLAPLIHRATR